MEQGLRYTKGQEKYFYGGLRINRVELRVEVRVWGFESGVFGFGFWFLVFGFWFLVSGFWFLVFGFGFWFWVWVSGFGFGVLSVWVLGLGGLRFRV